MESWLQRLLLNVIAIIATSFIAVSAIAQDDATEDENRTILDGVINPDIERRKIDESLIDSEDFEMGFMAGVMSIEDFGSSNAYGARVAYHVSEDWFIEAAFGAAETSRTSWEVLSGGRIIDPANTTLTYYNMSLGLNLFPGEIFIAKDYAFNTNYFVIAGLGNTKLGEDEFFTINYGAGFKIFPTDWVAMRIGFRNHLFTHDVLGVDKSVQNLEALVGLSLYF